MTSVDVAARAGVSQATVSLVLSGKAAGRVSREKADAVRRAAADLGYRPNIAARALRTGATRTVGLVVPDVTNPFFGRLLRGAQDAARAEGYAVAMIDAGRDRAWELESIDLLRAGPVDGLLLYGTEPPPPEDKGPVVLIDVHHRRLPTVRLDQFGGGHALGLHVASLGHRRVGHLAFVHRRPLFEERSAGLAAGLREGGLDPGTDLVVQHTRFSLQTARDDALALLERDPRPTAIVCDDDVIAAGALIGIRQRGLRVPADLSVTGFDDVDLAIAVDPPLTTVTTHTEALGATAFGVLHRRIEGRRTPRDTVAPVDLVVRASTGPPPAGR